MAEVLERVESAQAISVPLRFASGERAIGRILRASAVLSGSLFFASIVSRRLNTTSAGAHWTFELQKAAASVLLLGPVLRLAASGALLGLRGEWRYTFLAGGVLVLLGWALHVGIPT